MTDASGVAGQIHPAGIRTDASQTGLQNRKLIFAQLRCLVDGDDVVFLPLITQNVAVCRAVTEGDRASVGKGKSLFAFAVGEKPVVFGQEG